MDEIEDAGIVVDDIVENQDKLEEKAKLEVWPLQPLPLTYSAKHCYSVVRMSF